MTERTGGSRTLKDGKIIDIVEPTKDHPEGNRARDAQGRPLDELSRKQPAAAVQAPAPATPATKRRASFEAAD